MNHLVSLSAVTWDFPLIGRTRMLTEAWHALGIPTTFIQAPFLRSALERVLPWRRPSAPVRILRPWPTYPRFLWSRLSAATLRPSIRRRARGLRRQLDKVLDWQQAAAVVVSPLWAPWLEELPFRHVVYDCIDVPQVHVPRADLAPLYGQWERQLLARATAAVVTAEVLHRDIRERRPDLPVAVIRNGVDVDEFQRRAHTGPRPADLPPGERPIVGFVGVMSGGATYEWLDWDLIQRTVQALPGFGFVFVGPYDRTPQVAALRAQRNVHLLGWRPYAQIPAYIQAFSACWVPFSQATVGRAANPVKIYEYLALGKPVISTPVAGVEDFGPLVAVAHSADEMIEHLRAALSRPGEGAAARVAFARENSWETRARAFATFIEALSPASPNPKGSAATARFR